MIDAPRYVLTHLPTAPARRTGVLVIGAGAAGLTAALTAAEHAEVTVLARGALPESNSAWAQGGIAAALDAADSPHAHIADTLVAGAGLSDEAAVAALVYEAPALMRELAAHGVPFERDDEAHFALGLEGGHSARRIVHVGDATGWAVTRQLIAEAQAHPRITLLEGWQAADLLDSAGRVVGVLARDPEGCWQRILAGATIIASGGAGALYGLTSNQPVALGEGIAMAYRAGAELADMEFVQFHPTALATAENPLALVSEAVRGEGAILLDGAGRRFMPGKHKDAELAPRDIVAREIFRAQERSGTVHLDARAITDFDTRFPGIFALCSARGVDPRQDLIPVTPAAHYMMGGIVTDLDGRTTLPGMYACGEVACTGVHGANRLASNSLLEGLVFAERVSRDVAGLQGHGIADPALQQWDVPVLHDRGAAQVAADAIRTVTWKHAGIDRTARGLRTAAAELQTIEARLPEGATEELNMVQVARMIVQAALLRKESRGGHFRSDFPRARNKWRETHIEW